MSSSVEDGDFTVESSHEDEASVRANLGIVEAATDASDADGPGGAEADTDTSAGGAAGDGLGDGAGASATAEGDVAAADTGKKGKPRDNVQARINQALERQRQAEQRAATLERQYQELHARVTPAAATAAAPATPTASTHADFTFPSYDQYAAQTGNADWDAYRRAEIMAAIQWGQQGVDIDGRVQQALQQREQQQRVTQRQTRYQESVAAMTATHPDFEEQIAKFDAALAAAQLTLSPAVQDAILDLDNPADVVYWLATHPSDTLQLARDAAHFGSDAAPLVRQVLLARRGAGVSSGSVPGAPLSSAKPPIRPVGASLVTAPDHDPESEDFDSYFRRANVADRKAGRL